MMRRLWLAVVVMLAILAIGGMVRADQGMRDNVNWKSFTSYNASLYEGTAARFTSLDQGSGNVSVVLAPTGGNLGTTPNLQYNAGTLICGPATGTSGINQTLLGGEFITASSSTGNEGSLFLYDGDTCSTSRKQAIFFQAPVNNLDTFGEIYYTPACYSGADPVPGNALVLANLANRVTGALSSNPIYVLGVDGSHALFQAIEWPGDGSQLWGNSTPAVSLAGTCGIASIGGVIEWSCNGSAWAPFGTGTVTAVSATAPLDITGGASPTPNVVIRGSIVSGSTSTAAINLGTSVVNAMLACSTASSTCTPTAVTVAGGLTYNTGTGTETLGSFGCGSNTFVSSSSTAGLACTQPLFANLGGSLACSQLPALTGADGIATTGATCTVTNAYKGKVLVTGSDVTPDFLENKVTSPTGTIAISTPSVGTLLGLDAKLTKHDYFILIPSLQPADTANRFLATSFYTPQLTGLSGELPNDFVAGNIAIKLYLIASTGTATTYRCWSTLNGSVITGTQFTFTPGTTSPGVMAITAQPTGSASASDTFGEECVYDGNFVTGPFGATIAFSIQQVLSP